MHCATFTLRRAFDVQSTPLSGFRHNTEFSFETDEGKRAFAVQLRGRPHLQAGDRISVVLRDKDDWSSLVLWRNLTRGEVHRSAAIFRLLAPVMALTTVVWSAASVLLGGPLPWFLIALTALELPRWITRERQLREADRLIQGSAAA